MVYKTEPNINEQSQFQTEVHKNSETQGQPGQQTEFARGNEQYWNGDLSNSHLSNGPGGFYGQGTSPTSEDRFEGFANQTDLGDYKGPEPVYASAYGQSEKSLKSHEPFAGEIPFATSGQNGAPVFAESASSWRVTTFVAAGVLLSIGLGLSFSQKDSVVLADIPLITAGNLEERVRPEAAGGMFVPDRNMSIMNEKIESENLEDIGLQASADTLDDINTLDDNVLVPTPVSFHPEPDKSDDATIGDLLNQLQKGDAWTEGRLLQRRLGLNLANALKDAAPDPFAAADRELSSRISSKIHAPAAIAEAAKIAALEEEQLTIELETFSNDLSDGMDVASISPESLHIQETLHIPVLLEAPVASLESEELKTSASAQAHLKTSTKQVELPNRITLTLPSFGRNANIEPAISANFQNARVRTQPSNEVTATKVQKSNEPDVMTGKPKLTFNNNSGLSFVYEAAYAEPTVTPESAFTNFAAKGNSSAAFNPNRMVFFGQEVADIPAEIELMSPDLQFAAAGETNFVPNGANMLNDSFIDALNEGSIEVAQLSLDGQGVQPIFDGNAPLPPLVEEVEAEIARMNQGLTQQNLAQQQQGLAQQRLGLQQRAALDQARAAAASNGPPTDSPFGDAPIAFRPEVPVGLDGSAVGNPYAIQLASVRSQAKATATWKRLQKKFPEMLGDMVMNVQQAKVKGKLYYRVQAGPVPNRITGSDICATLKANRQDCIVAKRK